MWRKCFPDSLVKYINDGIMINFFFHNMPLNRIKSVFYINLAGCLLLWLLDWVHLSAGVHLCVYIEYRCRYLTSVLAFALVWQFSFNHFVNNFSFKNMHTIQGVYEHFMYNCSVQFSKIIRMQIVL